MRQQRIRLSESQLRNMIKEAVEQEMNQMELEEGFMDFIKGAGKKIGGDIKQGTQNAWNAGKQGAQKVGNAVKQGAQKVGKAVSDYAADVKSAGQQASNVADAQTAIKTIQGLVQKGILGQNIANMVVGNLKKYGNQ